MFFFFHYCDCENSFLFKRNSYDRTTVIRVLFVFLSSPEQWKGLKVHGTNVSIAFDGLTIFFKLVESKTTPLGKCRSISYASGK